MKNKIFTISFLVILLLISESGLAQEVPTGLSYGVRAGATVSMFSGEQPHTSGKMGFMIGGLIEYSINDKFAVQAEPSYMQQGGKFIRFSDDTRFGLDGTIYELYTTNSSITLHTLDLPILGKYRFQKFGDVQPNLVFGPAIGYTLNASNSYETTFYDNQTFTTVSGYRVETSQYQPFQLGITGGFGGEVSIGSRNLFIDFRYRYGVTPVKKSFSYIDLFSVQGDLRTHSAFVTIGVSL